MAYFPRGGVSSVPVTGVIKSSFTPCKLVRQPGPVFRAVLPNHEKNILIFQSFPRFFVAFSAPAEKAGAWFRPKFVDFAILSSAVNPLKLLFLA